MKTHFATFLVSVLFLMTLSGCKNCDRVPEDTHIPKSLEGMTLSGRVSSASGIFSGLEGYSFTTAFENNRTFTSKNSDDTESHGDFSYTRINDKSAHLNLIDRSSLHSGDEIEVTLNFDTPNKGTYTARFLSGKTGEHHGSFEFSSPIKD